jgi:hypothetical protein
LICRECKIEIEEAPHPKLKRFCSFDCFYAFKKANKKKPDPKPKIVAVKIICCNCNAEFKRIPEKKPGNAFCSKACFKEFNRGENSILKRTGKTEATRGPLWQKLSATIRKRDDYKCLRCGKTEKENGAKLSVDHVIPWRTFEDKNKANLPENLASLCAACHGWKTTTAERLWLEGDVIDMEKYIRSIRGEMQ